MGNGFAWVSRRPWQPEGLYSAVKRRRKHKVPAELTFGRWNETEVRVLRPAWECVPWSAAFFAVFALAADDVGVGLVGATSKVIKIHATRYNCIHTFLPALRSFCCSHYQNLCLQPKKKDVSNSSQVASHLVIHSDICPSIQRNSTQLKKTIVTMPFRANACTNVNLTLTDVGHGARRRVLRA